MAERCEQFDYEDLLACARGELFGPGNAQLPLPPKYRSKVSRFSREARVYAETTLANMILDPARGAVFTAITMALDGLPEVVEENEEEQIKTRVASQPEQVEQEHEEEEPLPEKKLEASVES